jgi:hypothetical protein
MATLRQRTTRTVEVRYEGEQLMHNLQQARLAVRLALLRGELDGADHGGANADDGHRPKLRAVDDHDCPLVLRAVLQPVDASTFMAASKDGAHLWKMVACRFMSKTPSKCGLSQWSAPE